MSILNDAEIARRIEAGEIVVHPFSALLIEPASLDIRLGRTVKIAEFMGHRIHDLVDDGPYHLSQGRFVLGATLEWVELPHGLIAKLDGKSTLARKGLVIENAGYVDPGWRGELTLEMAVLAPRPVALTHGMRIGQLRFEMLFAPAERPYGHEGSHYQDSRGPVEAAS